MLINSLVLLIFLLSFIYSIKYKFIQLNLYKQCKEGLKNKKSYIAFLLSLGSHIGAGNILGVTTALIIGGPGVLFWMVICTVLTTVFSLMENTIGIKYKVKIDNESRGGSPYYILNGLKNKKLSIVFSLFLVLSGTIFFLPIQVRGVSFSIKQISGINNSCIFVLFFLFSFFVIFKGTSKITKFIEKIVPIMTLFFLVFCTLAIILKINYIVEVFVLIIKEAFNFKSFGTTMILVGLKRSLFSNEAGLGTAPSINCYSDTKKPITQGYIQVLTCFIDTIVMCVMLGFIILLYDIDLTAYSGELLAIKVFEYILGPFGKIIGIFLLFTFSLATIVSGYYAGESNMLFNSIFLRNKVNILKFCYKLLFLLGIIIGIFFDNNKLWSLVDVGLVILGIINIYVIIKLQKDFKSEIINK